MFCSQWSPCWWTYGVLADAVRQAGCAPGGRAGSQPRITCSHLSHLAAQLYFWAAFSFQLQQARQRFKKRRQCLGNWKRKILKEKIFICELWIYSTDLPASLCITTCQDWLDAIDVGYLLSFEGLCWLPHFYRNAHLSVICFSSWRLALFLLKLLAIPVTEQETILLYSRLSEWRIKPLQNILFSWWLYWGERSKVIWYFRVSWQFH